MIKNQTKRFIAGAICPNCHLMDKIIVYTTENQLISECVRCGHSQIGTEDKQKTDSIATTKKSRKVIWLKTKQINS